MLTAAFWNTNVRDDIRALHDRFSVQSGTVTIVPTVDGTVAYSIGGTTWQRVRANTTVTFPTAFPTACLMADAYYEGLWAQPGGSGGDNELFLGGKVDTMSATGLTLVYSTFFPVSGIVFGAANWHWRALGY